MTRYLCAHFALLASIVLAPAAQAAELEMTADQAVFVADDSLTSSNGDVAPASVLKQLDENIELAQFASSLGGGSSLNLGGSGCTGQWFVGADYLNVRASFSQATAYLQTNVPAVGDPSFVYAQHNFDYEPNFRVYGGYRICDCGCEVRFAYTSIDSGGSFVSPETDATGGTVTVTGPFEVITAGDGDFVSGSSSVSIDNYDLGFSRTIPLGSPLGDCGCSDCCDTCGCWCPAWDIVWSGGIRIADVDSQLNYASTIVSTTAPLARTAQSNVSFQGVGLRTGMMGRRYIGKEGIASIYLKGDISVLVGDVENTAVGTAFTRHSITTTQVVPVTELEAGGTIFLTKCASISGGYMIGAWHDLGHRPEYDFGAAGVQLESWDDANILGVDGWFLRAELAY